MAIRIPKEFISGFETLKDLNLDQVEEISKFLATIPYGTGTKDFKERLNDNFPKIDSKSLSNTIYSLGSILLNFNETIEEIAKMLTESLKEDIENIEENNLQEKITLILNQSTNLKHTFKAYNLISDNDITYSKGRVFSDIRLLFSDDLKEENGDKKAVIIHKLKIEAEQDNTLKNFYFSMDSSDLLKMKELISRALDKDQKIRSDYPNIDFIKITD